MRIVQSGGLFLFARRFWIILPKGPEVVANCGHDSDSYCHVGLQTRVLSGGAQNEAPVLLSGGGRNRRCNATPGRRTGDNYSGIAARAALEDHQCSVSNVLRTGSAGSCLDSDTPAPGPLAIKPQLLSPERKISKTCLTGPTISQCGHGSTSVGSDRPGIRSRI